MDNNDPIQQANLVSDDVAAALNDTPEAVMEPQVVQPAQKANDSPYEPPTIDPVPTTDSTPPAPVPDPVAVADSDTNHDDLDAIKKSALDELQPLIEHVEQSPEERFETVMMMIRSNDDASLIAQAYEAAKGISDEKARANALLNIVSEIEYLKSKSNI